MLYQDDDFGKGGLGGHRGRGARPRHIVSKEPYQPGVDHARARRSPRSSPPGAQVLVDFTVPIYTAIAQLTSFTLGYKPQLVVSNVGIDPTTVGGLLKTISKGKASGTALIEGAITDGYLPSPTDTSNPWIQLFMKIHAQYDASAPFDGNVEYGMANAYTLVQALQAAGKDLTRQGVDQRDQRARRQLDGPWTRAVPLLDHRSRWLLAAPRWAGQERPRSSSRAGRSRPRRSQVRRSLRTRGRSPLHRLPGFRRTEGLGTHVCGPVRRPPGS